MKKRLSPFLLFIIFSYFISCQPAFKPLPQIKMTQILLEMHMAEAYVQQLPKLDSTTLKLPLEDSLQLYYAQILKKNKLSQQEFLKNIKWYAESPATLDSMYQNMLSDLSIKQVQLQEAK